MVEREHLHVNVPDDSRGWSVVDALNMSCPVLSLSSTSTAARPTFHPSPSTRVLFIGLV